MTTHERPRPPEGQVPDGLSIHDLIEAARLEEQRGALPLAFDCFAAAAARLRESEDTRTLADVVRWMGTVRREQGDTTEAQALYTESLYVAEAIPYRAGEAHALNCLAIIAQRRGSIDEASGLYRRAARFARDGQETRLLGMIEQNLGVLANIRGDLDGALVRYRAALEAFELADDQQAASWVLNNLGMLHTDLSRFDEARTYFERGLAIAVDREDRMMQAACHLNLAESLLTQRMWVEARAACEEAIRISEDRGDRLRHAGALKFLGVIERESGDLAVAFGHHGDALVLAKEGEDTLLEAELMREIGLDHAADGDVSEARSSWTRSAELFQSIGASLDASSIADLLAGLPEPVGSRPTRQGGVG
ncbi:MAG: tetratricopeptide repeat protein [Gemmatimonadota bacterium]